MDHVNPQKRSEIMKLVRSKNTTPELVIRKLLFGLGYRYRLHTKGLPGTPDLAFIGRRKAIFIHGCFWHGHECKKGQLPKSRTDYWAEKIQKNKDRDNRNLAALRGLQWDVAVVWQCELVDLDAVAKRLTFFLDQNNGESSGK